MQGVAEGAVMLLSHRLRSQSGLWYLGSEELLRLRTSRGRCQPQQEIFCSRTGGRPQSTSDMYLPTVAQALVAWAGSTLDGTRADFYIECGDGGRQKKRAQNGRADLVCCDPGNQGVERGRLGALAHWGVWGGEAVSPEHEPPPCSSGRCSVALRLQRDTRCTLCLLTLR